MEMASKAIVSTFKLITLCVKYCKQWINANDFARIICKKYGIPEADKGAQWVMFSQCTAL
jgi:hypothetical protein